MMRRVGLALLIVAGSVSGEPLPGGRTAEVRVAPAAPQPLRGPRYAPVTIDLYVTVPVQSPMARVEPMVRRLVAAGDVRVVYHLGGQTQPPYSTCLEALAEAEREGRFFALLDALVTRGLDPRPLAVEELPRIAGDAGLDGEAFAAALADHRGRERAAAWLTETRAAGHGANELLVNGVSQSLSLSASDLAQAVATQRKRARELAAQGVPLTRLYERLTRDDALGGALPGFERRRVTVATAGAPARGPEVAPVTVVILSSFVCEACRNLHRTLDRLDKRFPQSIRFVWKNLPTNPMTTMAAGFAAAAHARGRFWALYDHLRDAQLRLYRITHGDLAQAASAAGLDGAALDREVQADAWRAAVQRDVDDAHQAGISSPATVVVNGIVLAAPGYDQLESLVAREMELGLLGRLGSD